MKRILITGKNSYIGNSFVNYLEEHFTTVEFGDESLPSAGGKSVPMSGNTETEAQNAEYQIRRISMKEENWKEHSWVNTDAVLYVSGIAHVDIHGATKEMQDSYYAVNCDMAVAAAKKAKADGAGQFIYLSSIIVYGESSSIGQMEAITKRTQPEPANFYGDSKLRAEKNLLELDSPNFRVLLVRVPMVYGIGAKGNFPKLYSFSKKTRIFPKVNNRRSMIYIENLCEYFRLAAENKWSGISYPQNAEPVSVSELVSMIGELHGHRIWLVPGLTAVFRILSVLRPSLKKIFGNQFYDDIISETRPDYRMFSLRESLRRMKDIEDGSCRENAETK